MDEVNFLMEAGKFMALGMGVVFLFLTILIVVVKIQAKIIGKYFPDDETQAISGGSQSSGDDVGTVAAIVAAIAAFRKNN